MSNAQLQNDAPEMPALRKALNQESWNWISENAPDLATALQTEVQERGAEPDQIRRFVMQHTQRPALAKRCRQAAAYLVTLKEV